MVAARAHTDAVQLPVTTLGLAQYLIGINYSVPQHYMVHGHEHVCKQLQFCYSAVGNDSRSRQREGIA